MDGRVRFNSEVGVGWDGRRFSAFDKKLIAKTRYNRRSIVRNRRYRKASDSSGECGPELGRKLALQLFRTAVRSSSSDSVLLALKAQSPR